MTVAGEVAVEVVHHDVVAVAGFKWNNVISRVTTDAA